MPATTGLDGLGLDAGGHLLIAHALAALPPGDQLTVTGRHPALPIHLAAWCRAHGHRFDGGQPGAGPLVITKGPAEQQRWRGAVRAGDVAGRRACSADQRWGLAARGALVEAGGPPLGPSDGRPGEHVWADVGAAAVRRRGRGSVGPGDRRRLGGGRRRARRTPSGP